MANLDGTRWDLFNKSVSTLFDFIIIEQVSNLKVSIFECFVGAYKVLWCGEKHLLQLSKPNVIESEIKQFVLKQCIFERLRALK